MLDRQRMTDDTWLYVHDRDILFGRLHEPKNWSVDMVPDQSKTSVVAEYFCSFGDEIWSMSDDALVERTAKHLADDLGFVARNEVLGGFAVRCPRAYPSYTLGYERPLKLLKDFVDSFENLQIIGRYGTFRYNNADHSVETGLLAAKNILGETHDLDRVNADQEYHEIKRLKPAKDDKAVAGTNGNGHRAAPTSAGATPIGDGSTADVIGSEVAGAGAASAR